MPFDNYVKPFYDECLVKCEIKKDEDGNQFPDVPFKVYSFAIGQDDICFVVYDIEDLDKVKAFKGYLGIELPDGVEKFFNWTREVVPDYQPWNHTDYPVQKKAEIVQRIAQIDTKIEDEKIQREIDELLAKELGDDISA